MLDLGRIRSTPVRTDPYPFMVVTDTLQPQGVDALLRDFPQIRHPGSPAAFRSPRSNTGPLSRSC